MSQFPGPAGKNSSHHSSWDPSLDGTLSTSKHPEGRQPLAMLLFLHSFRENGLGLALHSSGEVSPSKEAQLQGDRAWLSGPQQGKLGTKLAGLIPTPAESPLGGTRKGFTIGLASPNGAYRTETGSMLWSSPEGEGRAWSVICSVCLFDSRPE